MKTNSIFFKIRIAFAISAFLILGIFALIYIMESRHRDMELHQRAMQSARIIKHMKEDSENIEILQSRLKELDFALPQEEEIKTILLDGDRTMQFEHMGPITISKYTYNGKRYIIIEGKERLDVIEDIKPKSQFPLFLLATLITILTILSLFYRSILNNIKPLKELTQRVEMFAKTGELKPVSNKLCDEINAVSHAFDKTATHLNNISKARSLFLRNIAHELKTPLSKGRFLAELVSDEQLKERFHTLFVHFDSLISELLQVERLSASGMVLDKKQYALLDCINEAIEIGFFDEDQVDITGDDISVFVDFKLFSLVLKNLLSNAIKYSPDNSAKIVIQNNSIQVSNIGEPLPRPLEQLFEPFVKGDESSDGLGLGLYIVRQILDAHAMKLSHEYNNQTHTFCIVI